jgi:hypothetical protein
VRTFKDFEDEARADLMEDARKIVGRVLKDRLRELEAAKMIAQKAQEQYDELLSTEITDDMVAQIALLPKKNGAGCSAAIEAIIRGQKIRVDEEGEVYTTGVAGRLFTRRG